MKTRIPLVMITLALASLALEGDQGFDPLPSGTVVEVCYNAPT